MPIKPINDKERALDTIGDSFMQSYRQIQDTFFSLLVRNLNQFSSRGGNFVAGQNLTETQQIAQGIIRQALADAGYYNAVSAYIRDFAELDRLNTDIQRQLSDIVVDMPALRPQRQAIVNLVSDGLVGDQFGADFIQPLKRALAENVTLGGSISDLREALERTLKGTEQVKGLEGRINFAATNAARQYDGAVNDVIAETYELNAYLYVGSLIKDSRPQCKRWVSKEQLLKSELTAEITRAINTGSGMIPGTTLTNFGQNRGGYNCRHQAYPIRV